MKVLFIDDDPDSVLEAQEELGEYYPNADIVTRDFEEGKNEVSTIRPQIVVLDIWKDDAITGTAQGLDVFDFIWDHCFCPLIVYSANTEITTSYANYEHPFVEVVKKGSESEVLVRKAVDGLKPHIQATKKSERLVAQNFASAMRDVAPYAFANFRETDEISEAVVRGGRRRLAALMDESLSDGMQLAAWEQYLSPPVTVSNRLGDVLRVRDGDANDPCKFRIILTPSCDLVSGRIKVKSVLVAKCCTIRAAFQKLQIGLTVNKIGDSKILSQGFVDDFMVFPALKGKIPSMAVNLKDLGLISPDEIDEDGSDFITVASIDSPFRELVSWAYLQVAGRPGLPERDFDAWIQEIIAAGRQPTEASGP